jgi:transposase
VTGIAGLNQMANTLMKHRQGLFDYFKHGISTGPIEGLNNKAQTMKRQAYGYRDLEFYKLKLMTLHRKRYGLVG